MLKVKVLPVAVDMKKENRKKERKKKKTILLATYRKHKLRTIQ